MQQGAQVRFNTVTGMRFKATVDTAAVDEYIAQGYTVTMGTLISPADIIGSFDALTFEADENNYLDVVTTGYFNEETGTIAGSISNIKEANYGRDFVGRGYATITKDGKSVTFYNDYYEGAVANNTRSLKFVSQAVIDDGSVSNYSEDQQQLINLWAAAADWSKPTAETE